LRSAEASAFVPIVTEPAENSLLRGDAAKLERAVVGFAAGTAELRGVTPTLKPLVPAFALPTARVHAGAGEAGAAAIESFVVEREPSQQLLVIERAVLGNLVELGLEMIEFRLQASRFDLVLVRVGKRNCTAISRILCRMAPADSREPSAVCAREMGPGCSMRPCRGRGSAPAFFRRSRGPPRCPQRS
jgi:hypothetical protein